MSLSEVLAQVARLSEDDQRMVVATLTALLAAKRRVPRKNAPAQAGRVVQKKRRKEEWDLE